MDVGIEEQIENVAMVHSNYWNIGIFRPAAMQNLMPILYLEKSTTVLIIIGNTIFGALEGEPLVD